MLLAKLEEFERDNLDKFVEPRFGKKYVSLYAPTVIYYIRIKVWTRYVYKLGITIKPVEERIKKMKIPSYMEVKVLQVSEKMTFKRAHYLESNFHNLNKKDKDWTAGRKDMWLLKSGNSEVYKGDVLGLDKEEVG